MRRADLRGVFGVTSAGVSFTCISDKPLPSRTSYQSLLRPVLRHRSVQRRRLVAVEHRGAVPPRGRRHLVAAAHADRTPDVPLPCLHGKAPARGRPAARPGGARTAARGRHARHVPRRRPDRVLRVLRGRAGPDVLPDRHLGRLSDRKQYAATKFILYTLLGSAFMLLGFLGIGLAHHSFDFSTLGVERAQPPRAGPDLPCPAGRFRHQDADVAAAHLAARRAHRGPDHRLGAARRRPAQDGHVRADPDRIARTSLGSARLCALPRASSRRSASCTGPSSAWRRRASSG